MKKIFLLLFSIFIFSATTFGQQYIFSELGGPNSLSNLGVTGGVHGICTDPAGNIYVAGNLHTVNSGSMRVVVKFDGTNWSIAGGTTGNGYFANGNIWSLCSDKNGNIYASGMITNSFGNYYVAKFDGTNWSEVGGVNSLAANGFVTRICVDTFGNLYAAGQFTNQNGNYYVAKFNGATWSELGGLNSLAANNGIGAIEADQTGNIYASGNFTNLNNNNYVAIFNGTNWSELGGNNSLSANDYIGSIVNDALGNIYVAGNFKNLAGHQYVAKFNGVNWTEVGGFDALGVDSIITTICSDLNGNIYAGGFFNINGKKCISKFNGTSWSNGFYNSLPVTYINKMITQNNNVLMTGDFTNSPSHYFVATNLHQCYTTFKTINYSICQNSNITINNTTYTNPGIYYDTLINHNGCDSILTINISIKPNSSYNITHKMIQGCSFNFGGALLSSSGYYVDTLVNFVGCDSFVTLNLIVVQDSTPICLVTVDSNSTHNIIIWDKHVDTKLIIDSFQVFRESATNIYSLIGSIHHDSLSTFHDFSANPNTTSYRYRLTAKNMCGMIMPMSHFHNTIQLQNLGNGNFQWTSYQIENEANPVNYYIVSRDDNSTGNFQPISSTIPGSNTTYTDVNFSSYPNASYRVAVNWNIACAPTKSTSTSYSNILKFGNAGIQSTLENTVHISPNPITSEALISLSGAINNATIKVMNVTGQTLLELSKQSGKQFSIDLSKETAGIYFVEIYEGEKVYHAKVVKQ